MKVIASVAVAAVMAFSSSAYAGGLFANVPVVSPNIGIGVGNINVLNGNVLGIANGSSILSGIANGNSVLNGINLTNNGSLLNLLQTNKKGW